MVRSTYRPRNEDVVLFDIRTCERKITTCREISKYTGMTVGELNKYMKNGMSIRNIGCYILPMDTPIQTYKDLLKKHEILKGEIWLDYEDYKVSNYGRVINHKGVFVLHYLSRGITVVKIHTTRHDLHTIVYRLFIGEIEDGYCVVHKNLNNRDCGADNLTTVPQNKRIYHYPQTGRRSIVRVCIDTGEVECFDSIVEGAKATYTSASTVNRALKAGKPVVGYHFYYENEYKGVFE